jgi:hypothetical protein
MTDVTDAALEAEFPETIGRLRESAAVLRAGTPPLDGDEPWCRIVQRAATPMQVVRLDEPREDDDTAVVW